MTEVLGKLNIYGCICSFGSTDYIKNNRTEVLGKVKLFKNTQELW